MDSSILLQKSPNFIAEKLPQQTNNDNLRDYQFNGFSVLPFHPTTIVPTESSSSDLQVKNEGNSIKQNIMSRNVFRHNLTTQAGLTQHLELLQTLYNQGIACSWQSSLTADVFLLPKTLSVIRKKHPDMNIMLLNLGFQHLAKKIAKLTDENIQSAKLIIGMNGLDTTVNHFMMADYRLETSAGKTTASIIFFDPTVRCSVIESLISIQIAKLSSLIRRGLKINYHYMPLNIQQSQTDCLLFSLELAKAAHKSATELDTLHKLTVIDKDKIDSYIPVAMMKHCQSYRRVEAYNKASESNGDKTTIPVNKKGESVTARYKRYSKVKYVEEVKTLTTSFSIESQRISFLSKIARQWQETNTDQS